MEKNYELWVFKHPALKKLIMEHTIKIKIIL